MTSKPSNIAPVLKILQGNQTVTMLGKLGATWTPFQVLIATILSARCRDEVTEPVAHTLFLRYLTCDAIATAPPEEVRKIIRRIGFFNAKTRHIQAASAMIRDDFKGAVPSSYPELMRLPGVGRKVAGCVLVYCFGKDAIPVDTHVHRISNRLGWVHTSTPEETEKRLLKIVPRRLWKVVNDTLVSHGKSICLPIHPHCSVCPVENWCERRGVR